MQEVPPEAEAWAAYFRTIRPEDDELLVSVALMSADRRGEHLSRTPWRRLRMIRYDPAREVLEVGLGGQLGHGPPLRCFISAPRRIVVEQLDGRTHIEVADASGRRTAIGLRRASERPEPAAGLESG